jgi:hypothetical protein
VLPKFFSHLARQVEAVFSKKAVNDFRQVRAHLRAQLNVLTSPVTDDESA